MSSSSQVTFETDEFECKGAKSKVTRWISFENDGEWKNLCVVDTDEDEELALVPAKGGEGITSSSSSTVILGPFLRVELISAIQVRDFISEYSESLTLQSEGQTVVFKPGVVSTVLFSVDICES